MSVPAFIPETAPPGVIAASELLTLHVPPVVVAASVMVVLGQSVATPVIEPVAGEVITVTVCKAVAVPQLLVTEYIMVSVPAVIPTIMLAAAIAEELLLLQLPPETEPDSVVDDPVQTVVAPEILPAEGRGLTVTRIVIVSDNVPSLTRTLNESAPV